MGTHWVDIICDMRFDGEEADTEEWCITCEGDNLIPKE